MSRSSQTRILREPSQRQLRVGEIIRRAVDECLRRNEIKQPELDGLLVTVPEVSMSPDLKHAAVYVAPLGGGDGAALANLLNDHARAIRKVVSKDLTMKFSPNLRFMNDTRYDEASKIENLLKDPKVRGDIERPGAADPADDS